MEANYIVKIKQACKRKKLTLKNMCEFAGLTEAGFHIAVKNDTLRVNHLEKMCEYLSYNSENGLPLAFSALEKIGDLIYNVVFELEKEATRLNLHSEKQYYRAVLKRIEGLENYFDFNK